MPARVEALPKAKMLKWARVTAGFDRETAAKKVPVRVDRLTEWENGERKPTVTQLRKLAHVYRRPIAVFYLSEPPSDVEIPRDFRRLPGEVAGHESPELRWEIRKAVFRRSIAIELLRQEGQIATGPDLEIVRDAPADEIATEIRALLGVTPEDQFSWRDPYASFNRWRAAIEEAGLLCLQMTEVPFSEARGFSISEFPLPIVVVNIKDTPRGRTFSLLHELTHILLRQGGLCDLDDVTSRDADALAIEQYCNAVAGSTLVPRNELLSDPTVRSHGEHPEWEDPELEHLSTKFAVSREVILRRLLDLNRTSPSFYRRRREQFLDEYEEIRRRRSPGFAPPHQVALASAGPSFTGLVLSSYSEGNITASDVSDFLGIRLKHLERIEQQLVAGGRSL